MTVVNLRPNESQEQLFKRFKKKVMKSGLMTVLRNKRWFVSKSEVRRMDKKKAIRRLRRKVDDPYDVKLIETIRGAGYRLRNPERK